MTDRAEITHDDKVRFIKHLFPKPMYSYRELAAMFNRNVRTISYWVFKYEVPTIKLTGSPMILQENLVNMLLKADAKKTDEVSSIGIEFCIKDALALAHKRKK